MRIVNRTALDSWSPPYRRRKLPVLGEIGLGTNVEYRRSRFNQDGSLSKRRGRVVRGQVWCQGDSRHWWWIADGKKFYLAHRGELEVVSQVAAVQLALAA